MESLQAGKDSVWEEASLQGDTIIYLCFVGREVDGPGVLSQSAIQPTAKSRFHFLIVASSIAGFAPNHCIRRFVMGVHASWWTLLTLEEELEASQSHYTWNTFNQAQSIQPYLWKYADEWLATILLEDSICHNEMIKLDGEVVRPLVSTILKSNLAKGMQFRGL